MLQDNGLGPALQLGNAFQTYQFSVSFSGNKTSVD